MHLQLVNLDCCHSGFKLEPVIIFQQGKLVWFGKERLKAGSVSDKFTLPMDFYSGRKGA
jgi:hypothetical protein